jgi:hypothetical protein
VISRTAGDGSLTGVPGVIPARPEVDGGVTSLAKPQRASKKPAPRRWLVIAVVVVLGTTGAVGAGLGMYLSLRPDDGGGAAETRPEAPLPTAQTPAVSTSVPEQPQQLPQKQTPVNGNDVPPSLEGLVLVDSSPQGAKVFLNGHELGRRTPLSLRLSQVAHVEVRLEGYLSSSKIFQPGQTALLFNLEKARARQIQGFPAGSSATKDFDAWAEHWRKQQAQGR